MTFAKRNGLELEGKLEPRGVFIVAHRGWPFDLPSGVSLSLEISSTGPVRNEEPGKPSDRGVINGWDPVPIAGTDVVKIANTGAGQQPWPTRDTPGVYRIAPTIAYSGRTRGDRGANPSAFAVEILGEHDPMGP